MVRIVYVDGLGKPGSLALPVDTLSALIMTLPTLANAALQARHGDKSLRIVFTLKDFRLEAAAGQPCEILTLATPDGFEVSFAVGHEVGQRLQAALALEPARLVLQ